MFGFGKKAQEAVNKYSGQTDLLEAICAADALVAAAEGGISKEEVAIIEKKCFNSKLLQGFDRNTIQKTIDRMCDRIEEGGRAAKRELKNEISEAVARNSEYGEIIVLGAIDVADDSPGQDGSGVGDKEAKIIDEIAALCGVKEWRSFL